MFAIIQNGTISQLVAPGTAFTVNGTQYPANWCNLSSPADKAAIGMVDVVYGAMPNQQYYWVTESAPVYNAQANVVNIDFTSVPKDFAPLQADAITQTKSTAYTILFPTDWMVVKAFETSTAIPTAWNTWRAEIRTQAQAQVAAIEATTTVAELAALPAVEWAKDPNYVPPTEVESDVQI